VGQAQTPAVLSRSCGSCGSWTMPCAAEAAASVDHLSTNHTNHTNGPERSRADARLGGLFGVFRGCPALL